jgi:hypothetical protein
MFVVFPILIVLRTTEWTRTERDKSGQARRTKYITELVKCRLLNAEDARDERRAAFKSSCHTVASYDLSRNGPPPGRRLNRF